MKALLSYFHLCRKGTAQMGARLRHAQRMKMMEGAMGRIIRIVDFDAPELDVYARLTEIQLRRIFEPDRGIFVAESAKVIHRALDAGYMPLSLLVCEEEADGQAKEILERCSNVPVYMAPMEMLKKLTGFPLTRGVLCAMRRKPLPSVREICENARRIAVLENVMNPTNLGAIIRSAAALYMDAVLLSPGCSDPLYRRAARVSMGTVFQVPWTWFPGDDATWQQDGMRLLKEMGFVRVSMALREDTVSLRDPLLRRADKLAVILGTEGEGLSQETIDMSDYTVRIPMSHDVDSLNVAAASAVAFWELGSGR